MAWTADQEATLRRMWAEGRSATQVAIELNCSAITRSAVCGKVHRMGLEKRFRVSEPRKPRPIRGRNAGQVMAAVKARLRRGPPVFKTEPVPEVLEVFLDEATILAQRCTLMDLTEMTCRFPLWDGDDTDFFFCGGKTWGDRPYCGHHCRVAYMPAPERRKEKPMPPVYVGSMERRWATV